MLKIRKCLPFHVNLARIWPAGTYIVCCLFVWLVELCTFVCLKWTNLTPTHNPLKKWMYFEWRVAVTVLRVHTVLIHHLVHPFYGVIFTFVLLFKSLSFTFISHAIFFKYWVFKKKWIFDFGLNLFRMALTCSKWGLFDTIVFQYILPRLVLKKYRELFHLTSISHTLGPNLPSMFGIPPVKTVLN